MGHSLGTVDAKAVGAQLRHSWGTISGQTREKLVWAQLRHIWGRVKVKAIVKVRN